MHVNLKCLWLAFTGTLSDDLGEFGYREVPAGVWCFYGRGVLPQLIMPFPFHQCLPTRSPKKLSPEERLRRYIEQKYGVMDVQKKSKNKVEKKP